MLHQSICLIFEWNIFQIKFWGHFLQLFIKGNQSFKRMWVFLHFGYEKKQFILNDLFVVFEYFRIWCKEEYELILWRFVNTKIWTDMNLIVIKIFCVCGAFYNIEMDCFDINVVGRFCWLIFNCSRLWLIYNFFILNEILFSNDAFLLWFKITDCRWLKLCFCFLIGWLILLTWNKKINQWVLCGCYHSVLFIYRDIGRLFKICFSKFNNLAALYWRH